MAEKKKKAVKKVVKETKKKAVKKTPKKVVSKAPTHSYVFTVDAYIGKNILTSVQLRATSEAEANFRVANQIKFKTKKDEKTKMEIKKLPVGTMRPVKE